MRVKAKEVLQDKLKNVESVLNQNLDSLSKSIADGYKVVAPLEMYNSYQSYNSSSLNIKKSTKINNTDKSTTLYYQSVSDKNFDFVMNPIVIEPVIQVMYELQLNIEKAEEKKTSKKYFFVTPNGDLKKVNFK